MLATYCLYRISHCLISKGLVKKFAPLLFCFSLLTCFYSNNVFAETGHSIKHGAVVLDYLGRDYNPTSDSTRFNYRLTRPSSLLGGLNSMNFNLPSSPQETSLIDVGGALSYLLQYNPEDDVDVLSFLNLFSLFNQEDDIVLEYLGNIGEGVVEVDMLTSLLATPITEEIVGPLLQTVLEDPVIDLPGLPVEDNVFPSCIIDSTVPQVVEFTNDLLLNLDLQHATENLLKIEFSSLPDGAIPSAVSGSLIDTAVDLSILWTPTQEQIGTIQSFLLSVVDSDGDFDNCLVDVRVVENQDPTIITQDIDNPIECRGTITGVYLDASASNDPEGLDLEFAWSHDCTNANLKGETTATPVLFLSDPGLGLATSCSVTLSASDGEKTSIKNIAINVQACDVNCAMEDKDACGVCNGRDLCLDCSGIAFGEDRIDRCGVCGGQNDCLDCRGDVNGDTEKDVCGICEGDGTSCRGCVTSSFNEQLLQLTEATVQQEKLIQRTAKRKRKNKQIKKFLVLASKLRQSNWETTWSLPRESLECAHYLGCSTSENTDTIVQYKKNAAKLKRVSFKVYRKLLRSGVKRRSKGLRVMRRKARILYRSAQDLAESFPRSTNACN